MIYTVLLRRHYEQDIQRLQACLRDLNVILNVTDDVNVKQEIDALVISADITQFADPDYRDELNKWITQGEFGYRWLIARVGQLAGGSARVIAIVCERRGVEHSGGDT